MTAQGALYQPYFDRELHEGCVVFLGAGSRYGVVQKFIEETDKGYLHLVRGMGKLPSGYSENCLTRAIWG